MAYILIDRRGTGVVFEWGELGDLEAVLELFKHDSTVKLWLEAILEAKKVETGALDDIDATVEETVEAREKKVIVDYGEEGE